MTPKQRIHLQAELWPRACATQKWNPKDREKKLEVIGKILGREISSSNEIEGNKEFDAVKRELGFLADNLTATVETIEPERGRARRLREKIRDQKKCLGLYHPNPDGYVQTIIYDKFGAHGWGTTIEDLSDTPGPLGADGKHRPSELEQLVMTLAGAIDKKRRAAGHTVHVMLTRAGVECWCAGCKPKGMRRMPMAGGGESDLAGEAEYLEMAKAAIEAGPESSDPY